MAVSDAAMLAPEEVFAGKGDVKEETELTQAERKRRRAKKKRKFKGKSFGNDIPRGHFPWLPVQNLINKLSTRFLYYLIEKTCIQRRFWVYQLSQPMFCASNSLP